MIRPLLHLFVALVTTFSLAVAAILAQPRSDDAAIAAFYAPPSGCTAPCFLGIRPGATTRDQLLGILNTHPWVGIVTENPDSVSWGWNGSQPGFVNNFGTSFLLGSAELDAGIVRSIRLQTTTRWADFYFLFGRPDYADSYLISSISSYYRVYRGLYATNGFAVETSVRCPMPSPKTAWYSTILITWPDSDPAQTDERTILRGC